MLQKVVNIAAVVLYTATLLSSPTSPTNSLAFPLKRIHGHIILGFADGTTTQFLANTKETISLFSPLSFFITSAQGALRGSINPAVVEAAHARGIAVWPMIEAGFNPSRTTSVLTHPAATHALLTAILSDVKRYHLDGINLDFEDMIPSDAPRYTAFAHSLAVSLHRMRLGLSIDITPPSSDPNWGIVYQRAALANLSNYVVVMSYDEHYSGDNVAGSVASLPWMRTSIAATLAAGVPAARLLSGIPFYTRDWYRQQGQEQSDYLSLQQQLTDEQLPGAHQSWNAHTEQTILTFPAGGITHTIWLENATSLRERGHVTRELGLAGAAIWQLDLGDQTAITELVRGLLK